MDGVVDDHRDFCQRKAVDYDFRLWKTIRQADDYSTKLIDEGIIMLNDIVHTRHDEDDVRFMHFILDFRQPGQKSIDFLIHDTETIYLEKGILSCQS